MATFQTASLIRAEATLPAAGAFSVSDAIPCNTFKQVTFHFAYTRGAAGGALRYKVEFTNDKNFAIWKQVCEFSPPTIVAGTDSVTSSQRTSFQYTSTAVGREAFMSPTFNVSGRFVRISVAESGAVGTPGIASVECYLRGDQT